MPNVVKANSTSTVVKANASTKVVNTKMKGGIMDVTRIKKHETPSPATDGSQKVFTLANAYVAGTLDVHIDGLLQIITTDYAETSPSLGTFSMVVAPASDETVEAAYTKAV